ncbi:MAG: PQQ-dependent sugar dehydrogenase [Myxococcales bacterium]
MRTPPLAAQEGAAPTQLDPALLYPKVDPPSGIVADLVPVARGFERPLEIVSVPGTLDTALVLEQAGRVFRVSLGSGEVTFWFSVPVDASAYERGLLGAAFHPDFLESGRLFFNYTVARANKSFSVVSEWRVSDPKQPFEKPAHMVGEVLQLEQPFPNHNGGCLRFGPDGMLYIGFGDGGAANDLLKEGQDGRNWLGSMLRIDVDGEAPYQVPADNPFLGRADMLPETFAIGLRNPWRYTFAPDGRLIVADVGQQDWEELDILLPGDNLGWSLMEGANCFHGTQCDQRGLRLPFHVYGHDMGQSITGGEVVLAEGPLRGLYVFGDFLSGRLWAVRLPAQPDTPMKPVALGQFAVHPSSFGRDPEGRLYLAGYVEGVIYRLDVRSL